MDELLIDEARQNGDHDLPRLSGRLAEAGDELRGDREAPEPLGDGGAAAMHDHHGTPSVVQRGAIGDRRIVRTEGAAADLDDDGLGRLFRHA